MSDVFLSYARADRDKAERLAEALRARSWSVWLDTSLQAGDYWDDEIAAALSAAKCVVVLWSRESVQSHWVKSEAEQARQRGILVPANIDGVSLPYGYARLHTADLTDWRGAENHRGLSELIAGIAQILNTPAEATHSRSRRRRIPFWSAVAFFVLLAGGLVALNTIERDWTAISLDVRVSGVSFTADRASILSDLLVVSELEALGVRRLEIPRTATEPERTVALEAGPGAVRLSLDEARNGSITLAPIGLPASSRVSVFAGGREREFRIRVDRAEALTVNVAGKVRLALAPQPWELLTFAFPEPMLLQSGGETDIALQVNSPVENALPAPIPVTNLNFIRAEERLAGDRMNITEVSTIKSGAIRLESGQPQTLGNDRLVLTDANGSLGQFELSSKDIRIRFEGKARRVGVCTGEGCRNLSMTLGMWLWRRQRIAVISVGVVYMVAALLLMRALKA